MLKENNKINNVILSETKNLMRSFTNVQDDNQHGRSMIEMLGVLAIIGVLSVGGIAGYTTAMRSYKANEIINATSMLYMMGLASNGGEGDATNLTYTGNIGASLSALKEITYNNGAITVEITEDAVCNQVKTKLGDKVTGGDCTTKNSNNSYELTVTFGEVTAQEYLLANDNSDLGTDCTGTGFVCAGSGVLHTIYQCVNGKLVWAEPGCEGSCTDFKMHSTEAETCNGELMYH